MLMQPIIEGDWTYTLDEYGDWRGTDEREGVCKP